MLLEAPAHLGNLGAVVRVAAAAGAAAVLTRGRHDPWHPVALRGSAGLHFALPVARVEAVPPASGRPLLAIDPDRRAAASGNDPRGRAPGLRLGAPGPERRRCSRPLSRRIAIPMRQGVSSLNLASAVAVILYVWRLGQVWGRRSSAGRRD